MAATRGASRTPAGVRFTQTSRTSDQGAGWGCGRPGSYVGLMPTRDKRLSWFNPGMLFKSRNDVLARHLSDPVPEERAAWTSGLSDEDLTVDLSTDTDRFSFLVLGDTGEGDHSQYALVPSLLSRADDTAFLLICSDVLYPIGDVNDYGTKFYRPYSGYPGPIYALPGNHDWYDGLFAFMYHICGRRSMPDLPKTNRSGLRAAAASRDARAGAPSDVVSRQWNRSLRRFVRTHLWRRAARPEERLLSAMAAERALPSQRQPAPQRGPYFVLDTAELRLVCIDTGIVGNIDTEQGKWLLRVSADRRPKILLTGKPLLVDGEVHGCPILGEPSGYRSVLDVVHDESFRYIASIGGDTHNYQRYPVHLGSRTVQHVVSGGAGAFMHATHLIDKIDPGAVLGVTEEEFRCYPLRRDSLAAYSRVLQGMLARLHIPLRVEMSPDEAAIFLADRLGMRPLASRPIGGAAAGAKLPGRTRALAQGMLLFGGKAFHHWFSPFYDWDSPPFFKQFLRVDVSAGTATVTCYGVTGCGESENDPPIEDQFTLTW
jgi:Calcineurin-like phosphoesterase